MIAYGTYDHLMRCTSYSSKKLSGTPLCQGSRHQSGRDASEGKASQEPRRSLLDIALYAKGSPGITHMGNCLLPQLTEFAKQPLWYPGRKFTL